MFHASGTQGRLLALYAEAAQLGAWTLATGETIGGATTFDAAITHEHDLLLRYRPMAIALTFGAHEWRWTLTALQVRDGRLRATATGEPVVFPRR